MNLEFIIPVMIFALTMSITPGPNNIMLTASGANFGFLRTIPHILGVVIGVAVLNFLSALGLNRIFDLYPSIQNIFKYVGMTYMFFLAFKIALSSGVKSGNKSGKPLGFIQAILFQALNPKAVIMSLTAITVYSVKGILFYRSVFWIILIFIVLGFCSISVWALFGTIIKRLLTNRKYLKIFNYSMGFLCGISALLLLK